MGVSHSPRRGDVFLVEFTSTQGREIRKTRPALIVSPDEMNLQMDTFIAAPMTTGARAYLFRTPLRFGGKSGHAIFDQIQVVDASRLIKRLGKVSEGTLAEALSILQEMFAP